MRYGKWFLLGMFLVGVLAATTSPAHASTFSSIDVPGAFATAAHGINDRGQIVGEYVTITGGPNHGFVLDHGTFTTIDAPGSTLTRASGINNRGEIVGDTDAGQGFALH